MMDVCAILLFYVSHANRYHRRCNFARARVDKFDGIYDLDCYVSNWRQFDDSTEGKMERENFVHDFNDFAKMCKTTLF